jgi:hypothetical protein
MSGKLILKGTNSGQVEITAPDTGSNISLDASTLTSYDSANAQSQIDSSSVTLTGNQTVAGIKTFSDSAVFSSNVGIGTTSPARTLDVSSGSAGVAITTKGSASGSYITFQDGTTTNDAKVRVGAIGDDLLLFGGGSERMRVLDDGGITFNGDTTSANALDDYEEGTWTPIIMGYAQSTPASQTYSSQVGHYTKVGRLVYATYAITLTNKGNMSGDYVLLQGFPFSRGGGANFGGLTYFSNMATSVSSMFWEVTTSADAGWLQYISSSGSTGTSYMNVSGLNNNTIIQGSVVYYST